MIMMVSTIRLERVRYKAPAKMGLPQKLSLRKAEKNARL